MRPHPLAPSPRLPPDRPGEGEIWPLLTGVVVHWHNEELLAELAAAWPRDPRFELLVVDNGSSAPLPPGLKVLHPGRNLGFGGGANAGAAVTAMIAVRRIAVPPWREKGNLIAKV